MSPPSTSHSLLMSRNRVVLPIPFWPTIPTLWPAGITADAFSSIGLPSIASKLKEIELPDEIKVFLSKLDNPSEFFQ